MDQIKKEVTLCLYWQSERFHFSVIWDPSLLLSEWRVCVCACALFGTIHSAWFFFYSLCNWHLDIKNRIAFTKSSDSLHSISQQLPCWPSMLWLELLVDLMREWYLSEKRNESHPCEVFWNSNSCLLSQWLPWLLHWWENTSVFGGNWFPSNTAMVGAEMVVCTTTYLLCEQSVWVVLPLSKWTGKGF